MNDRQRVGDHAAMRLMVQICCPSSQHGSVEHDPVVKETRIRRNHFPLLTMIMGGKNFRKVCRMQKTCHAAGCMKSGLGKHVPFMVALRHFGMAEQQRLRQKMSRLCGVDRENGHWLIGC